MDYTRGYKNLRGEILELDSKKSFGGTKLKNGFEKTDI